MGRIEEGEVSLQATWDQAGRILSQQGGFQVSKGEQERGAKGNQQGDNATCIISLNVYIIMCVNVRMTASYTCVGNNCRYKCC